MKCGSAIGGNYTELMRQQKNHLRANFPYQRLLSEERLMQEIRSRRLFVYIQCDLKVPEHLKASFGNFSPFFINTMIDERICRKERDYVTTKKKTHVKLPHKKWNYHHSLKIILVAAGS